MTTLTDIDFNIATLAPSSDTLVINGSDTIINGSRYSVTAMSAYNNTGGDVTIEFYISFDETSANGTEIASHTLSQGQSCDVWEVIGQGFQAGSNIIAFANGGGVVVKSSGTIYQEDA